MITLASPTTGKRQPRVEAPDGWEDGGEPVAADRSSADADALPARRATAWLIAYGQRMADTSRVRVYVAFSSTASPPARGAISRGSPGAGAEAESVGDIGAASRPIDQDVGAVGFEDFMSDVGALLMGRRTYEAVAVFAGASPYGDRPVLVATHRALEPVTLEARPVAEMVAAAREAAGSGPCPHRPPLRYCASSQTAAGSAAGRASEYDLD